MITATDNKEEIETIESLDLNKQEDILKREYDSNIVELLNEKYFIYDNLDRYMNYIKLNPKEDLKDVVTLVNVNIKLYNIFIIKKEYIENDSSILLKSSSITKSILPLTIYITNIPIKHIIKLLTITL